MGDKAIMVVRGGWHVPVAVKHALCADGRRRRATITAEADTFFSIPARVQVKGRTVAGFITGRESSDGSVDYAFIAYSYRTNGYLLPGLVS